MMSKTERIPCKHCDWTISPHLMRGHLFKRHKDKMDEYFNRTSRTVTSDAASFRDAHPPGRFKKVRRK